MCVTIQSPSPRSSPVVVCSPNPERGSEQFVQERARVLHEELRTRVPLSDAPFPPSGHTCAYPLPGSVSSYFLGEQRSRKAPCSELVRQPVTLCGMSTVRAICAPCCSHAAVRAGQANLRQSCDRCIINSADNATGLYTAEKRRSSFVTPSYMRVVPFAIGRCQRIV